MISTALGAENERKTNTMTFINQAHKEFYQENMQRCRYQDEYHKALIYCLGISNDTRRYVDNIYDFKTGCVKEKCLYEGWQTSGSQKVVRLAFNLYCNGMPSVYGKKKTEDKVQECQRYTVEDIFCCEYAPYFWEAVKLRYPEYCLK